MLGECRRFWDNERFMCHPMDNPDVERRRPAGPMGASTAEVPGPSLEPESGFHGYQGFFVSPRLANRFCYFFLFFGVFC